MMDVQLVTTGPSYIGFGFDKSINIAQLLMMDVLARSAPLKAINVRSWLIWIQRNCRGHFVCVDLPDQ